MSEPEPIHRYGDYAICGRECRLRIGGVPHAFTAPPVISHPVAVHSFLSRCAQRFLAKHGMTLDEMNRFLEYEAHRMLREEGWRWE